MWNSIKRIFRLYFGTTTAALFFVSWLFPALLLTDIRSGNLGTRAMEGRVIAIFVSVITFVMAILGVVVQRRLQTQSSEEV